MKKLILMALVAFSSVASASVFHVNSGVLARWFRRFELLDLAILIGLLQLAINLWIFFHSPTNQ